MVCVEVVSLDGVPWTECTHCHSCHKKHFCILNLSTHTLHLSKDIRAHHKHNTVAITLPMYLPSWCPWSETLSLRLSVPVYNSQPGTAVSTTVVVQPTPY